MRNISIVIPHFNKNEALQETWKELMLQIESEDEIIITDDHSKVKPELDCPCTRTIQPPKMTPHIYRLNTLRNLGVEHSSNDAVVILDPDCIPNPKFIEHARKIYDPSILYAGWINYLNEDGSLLKEDPRKGDGKSRWVDRVNRSCGMVWGGCMYFSKKRASLVGLYDTDFDGHWGAEDHVFGSACRNSGMRLRYERGLTVSHQWHIKNKPGNQQRNIDLFKQKIANHRTNLNLFTPYNPAIAVLMVSMMRPYYIDQNMRAIFRHNIPLKVRLVNNGDRSKSQENEMQWWSDRWAVDYINHKTPQLLSNIRSDTMRYYHDKKYKYLIICDDDITPMYNSITNLIIEAETHPEYHAISGYIIDWGERKRSIGGKIHKGEHYYYYPVKPMTLETDYISSGFTIIRLNKVVPFTEGWEMGWADWDWSHEVRKAGLRLATTGKAGAYHRFLFTSKGKQFTQDPEEYRKIRRDTKRHDRMGAKYMDKWGYFPYAPKPINVMKV